MRKRFKLKNIVLPDRNAQKRQGEHQVEEPAQADGRSVGVSYCAPLNLSARGLPQGREITKAYRGWDQVENQ